MNAARHILTDVARFFSTVIPRPSAPALRGGLAFLLLVALSGCASIPFFAKTAKYDWADAKNPAVEILTLWQSSEGPGPGGVPIRGFAGQIYFFTQSKQTPVLVAGKVRIYIFDDRGTVEEQGRPIGEFDFDPVGWAMRAHRSSLGPGYAVFIPYPRNDFHQAACSLRVRFTPNVGPTIYSSPSVVVLNGPSTKPLHDEEPIVQPPDTPRAANANRTLSVTLGPSFQQASSPRGVLPVAGSDADTRFSLGNDVSADDDGSGRVTPIPDEVASTSHRIKLQSAQSDAADEE